MGLGLKTKSQEGWLEAQNTYILQRSHLLCNIYVIVGSMQIMPETLTARRRNKISRRFDLTGQKFHKLTVIRFHDIHHKSRRWECLCDCGKTVFAPAGDLVAGKRISCGCERLTLGNNTKYKYDSKQAFTNTKAGALKRGYTFHLTFEQFKTLVNNSCFYCGDLATGLDRVNNDGNYELENLVACCAKCNRMKNVLNQTEFLALIKKIYENRFGEPNG